MTSRAQAYVALLHQRTVKIVSAGPLEIGRPVHDVRDLPAEIASILPRRTVGWYQVLIDFLGSQMWINASPDMIRIG